jgi:hypothetical protein
MFTVCLILAMSCPFDRPESKPGGVTGAILAAARRQKASDDRAKVEYGRTIQRAHDAWQADQLRRSRELLDSVPWELRGWEWRYLAPEK